MTRHTTVLQFLRRKQWLRVIFVFAMAFQNAIAAAHAHNDRQTAVASLKLSSVSGFLNANEFEPENTPAHNGEEGPICQMCWSAAVAASAVLAPPAHNLIPPSAVVERGTSRNISPAISVCSTTFDARGPPAPLHA